MSLKDDLKKGNPIIGQDISVKKMKNQDVSKVYVASNFKNKNVILSLGKALSISVEVIDEDSKKLGVLCKKQFNVSVVSFQ